MLQMVNRSGAARLGWVVIVPGSSAGDRTEHRPIDDHEPRPTNPTKCVRRDKGGKRGAVIFIHPNAERWVRTQGKP